MALALLMPLEPARADSPLTSTQLADAYQDLPIVQLARRQKVAEGEILAFLIGDAPTDQKAAVINALGWDIQGQRNGYRFVAGLAAARGLTLQEIRLQHLRSVDRFVLGYLLAMDDYFKLSPLSKTGHEALWQASPLQLVSQAAYDLPDDFTVHFVRSMVQGQREFARSGCSIYLEPQEVLAQFPLQQRNMRSQAVDQAMQYLKNYESYCQQPAFAHAQPSTNPELNQIYKIAMFQNQIVTATQGGIVFWNPQTQTATATREERLCTSVTVWSESLWVGCRHRLWRFDGNQWKLYRYDPQSVEGGFHLLKGPQGQLLARHRGQLWQFDTNRDRFVIADTELGSGQGYDLIYRQNGEQWRIDFLKGLERNQQRLALRSKAYPGRDPRSFYEDTDGQLWVVDFKDGFFRYDDDSQKFRPVGEVTRQGSAIAANRTHTYFLHYTSGLYIRRQGEAQSEFINLSELRYMRDLSIDPKGDIWVAGWNQLIRLRKQGKNWLKDVYRLNS
ncbi:hypothetical protein [Acaryochloris sp. IP29b_bin.137]|uniref:hypothetical protein n=1 Tax=Acaryochloris sp. IP29b_bin.137 TaxID=2969217 RepID=UPI0026239BFB|nr:hypothetical protein [Acaryochloris sp. IP29b_bin.137]